MHMQGRYPTVAGFGVTHMESTHILRSRDSPSLAATPDIRHTRMPRLLRGDDVV